MTEQDYEELRKKLAEEYGYLRKQKGWGTRELSTFVALLIKYRELRQQLGPRAYITREELAQAYGSNSNGTASKFMGVIEELEADQPYENRGHKKPEEVVSSPHSPSVQKAFDGIISALETASRAVMEARTAENAEISRRYQSILQEQQTAADADRQAYEVRVADLGRSSSRAGDESWKNSEAAENLRAKLVGVEAERDAAVARAEQADHDRQLGHVQRAAAEALVEALQASATLQSAEVSRIQERCTAMEGAAAEVPALRAEAAALREHADALTDEICRQEKIILEVNRRHEAERAAMRDAYVGELADERRRSTEREAKLLAWFGNPGRRQGESN